VRSGAVCAFASPTRAGSHCGVSRGIREGSVVSTLEGEELGRLRAIEVSIVRQEVPSFQDLSWLVDALYRLSHEIEELEKQGADAEERLNVVENRLEEELEKTASLTKGCASLAAECDATWARMLELQAKLARSWHPERLRFLHEALSACVKAVELAGDESMLTKGDNGSMVQANGNRNRKRKRK
jgi:hypothetical protein